MGWSQNYPVRHTGASHMLAVAEFCDNLGEGYAWNIPMMAV